MTQTNQRERVRTILRAIETNIGRAFDAPGEENLPALVESCLEEPLSDDADEADIQVCEVLLHLGTLTGDE